MDVRRTSVGSTDVRQTPDGRPTNVRRTSDADGRAMDVQGTIFICGPSYKRRTSDGPSSSMDPRTRLGRLAIQQIIFHRLNALLKQKFNAAASAVSAAANNILVAGTNLVTYVAKSATVAGTEAVANYVAAYTAISSGTSRDTTSAVTAVITNRTGW